MVVVVLVVVVVVVVVVAERVNPIKFACLEDYWGPFDNLEV